MPSLKFDMNDVKPLLSSLGIGQDEQMPAPVVAQPLAPQMPPQPIPAQAGFGPWSGDPQNAKKVADGIVAPRQPLLAAAPQPGGPTGPMASMTPPQQAPMASMTPPNRLPQDQAELQRLQTSGSGISQIKSPWLRALGHIGEVVESVALPGAAAMTPGTAMHNRALQGIQQGRIQNDQTGMQAAAQLADTQSQTALRKSQGDKADSQADDMTPFTMSPAQAAAINQPALAGTTATMRDYSRLLGMAGNNNTSTANNTGNNATKVTTTGMNNSTSTANNAATNTTRVLTNAATNSTRVATTKAKPAAGMGLPPNAPGQPSPLVQAIIEGRSPPPNIRMRDGQALMQQVTAADPTYDSSRYNTYQAMQKEATSGKTGQMINSLNTIQEHLGRALKNMPHNTGNSTVNWLKNTSESAMGGNPTGKYEVDATGIAGEWSKLVAGGVASDSEQKHVMDLLSPNASPQKMKDNLAEVKAMTDGKLSGIMKQLGSAHISVPGNPIDSLPANNMVPPQQGGGGISVTAPDGSVHPFATQAQAAAFKKLAGIK